MVYTQLKTGLIYRHKEVHRADDNGQFYIEGGAIHIPEIQKPGHSITFIDVKEIYFNVKDIVCGWDQ